MVKIYNSLTNRLEEFVPHKPGEVSMYVCGSTVYNYMHIGNSRPVVFFDLVQRFFEYLGYTVKSVTNFTDVDDKIIAKAQAEGVAESVVTARYIAAILETYQKLNCRPFYAILKATETMPEIIAFVEGLLEQGAAYVVDGDVYFDVTRIADYGVLSKQNIADLKAGSRIEVSDKKRSQFDFNLWKETSEGVNWQSPWSNGRPGWHTECVVMINKALGPAIDIHGGGVDLKFPHHENEIAQSEALHHNKIARYWMHNGLIDFGEDKMSKSLGNVLWAHELLERLGYPVYRLFIMSAPYRQPLAFDETLIAQAQANYEKIRNPEIILAQKLQLETGITEFRKQSAQFAEYKTAFIAALSNDFNVANALTVLYDFGKKLNVLARARELDSAAAETALALYGELQEVLGIHEPVLPLAPETVALYRTWQKARSERDYARADELRSALAAKGLKI